MWSVLIARDFSLLLIVGHSCSQKERILKDKVRTFAATSAASLDIYVGYSRGPTVLYDTAAV